MASFADLRIDHVAVLVSSVEAALPYYRDTLGMTVSADETLLHAGARLCYLDGGGSLLQLVEPISPGPLRDHLDREGEGLHHICFAVADIDAAIAILAPGESVRVTMGGRGRRAAFIPNRPNGLRVELTELVPAGGQEGTS